jgi:hypothetical protein
MKHLLATFAFAACFGSVAALAQGGDDFIRDQDAWQRLQNHITQLNDRLANEVGSGAISASNAWQIQKELDSTNWHALYQHDHPDQQMDYDVRDHLRHVHEMIGCDWKHEFERR